MPTRSTMRRRSVAYGHRWLLYVVLALAGALLTFVGARAQSKASDNATFRKLIDGYCSAWSSGDPDKAAKYYAKDATLTFYDLTPFSYTGWTEYDSGVRKNIFEHVETASLTAGKELKVTRHGNIAWTTVPMRLTAKFKDGKSVDAPVRYTGIWEKRGKTWLLVHEHLSLPMGG